MKQIVGIMSVIIVGCNQPVNNDSLDHNRDSVESKEQMTREIENEAQPAYIEAYKQVNEIKSDVSLAEQGLLKEKQVIDHYNKTIGTTMGSLNKLNDIKVRLDTAGKAFIDYKFKKACADIAMQKATESKLKADTMK